jgi:hypothetical protein
MYSDHWRTLQHFLLRFWKISIHLGLRSSGSGRKVYGIRGWLYKYKYQTLNFYNTYTMGMAWKVARDGVGGSLCYTLSWIHQSTSYMHRQHVSDLKWVCVCELQIVFKNSTVHMHVVTFLSHPRTPRTNLWCAHSIRSDAWNLLYSHIINIFPFILWFYNLPETMEKCKNLGQLGKASCN